MSNKWFLIFVIFWFTAFCQLPFIKAQTEQIEQPVYPDQTPLPEKINEAQKIAFTALMSFEDVLQITERIKAELAQLDKKHNPRKMRRRIEELKSARDALKKSEADLLNKTLLVVLNRETGALREIYIQEPEYGKNKTGKPQNSYRAYTENCVITKTGGNGHGKNFIALCDNRVMPVLALAHFHEKEQSRSKNIRHVYTPYSGPIHDAVLIENGKKYLNEQIKSATEKLEKLNVPSKAFPQSYVHQKITANFIKALIINEHLDHDEFAEAIAVEENSPTENEDENNLVKNSKNKERALKALLEKVLVILGANREQAYIFSVSKAHACCLTQFIPSTYHVIRQAYPSAKLPSDFFEAMRNHATAIQAMVLLLDYDMSQFSQAARELCESSQELLEDCLAVSYNGGHNRLNGVIQTYGENWDMQKAVRKGKRFIKKGLTKETIIYLQKIRKIRELEK